MEADIEKSISPTYNWDFSTVQQICVSSLSEFRLPWFIGSPVRLFDNVAVFIFLVQNSRYERAVLHCKS